MRIEGDDAYANLALPALLERSGLDERDRAFATELVYGTIRMRRACDFCVDRFVLRDPDPEVRAVLRLGAYQLVIAGVAPHAAVAETVSLAPGRARGFVNAVLRQVAAAPPVWPDEGTRLSYPDWIVDRFRADLGDEDGLTALEWMNRAPKVTRRADGYVQDLASTWVAHLVDAGSGARVLDTCAAPGGKATELARRGAHVVAADVRPGRAAMVARAAALTAPQASAVTTVAAVVADGCRPAWRPGAFDAVLVDAPCSGLGVLRRRPDARWRVEPGQVDRLAELQAQLVLAGADAVAPGGQLVYSVCTLTTAETTGVARQVSRHRPDLVAEPVTDERWRPVEVAGVAGAMVLPQDHDTDGMAVFRWRRAD